MRGKSFGETAEPIPTFCHSSSGTVPNFGMYSVPVYTIGDCQELGLVVLATLNDIARIDCTERLFNNYSTLTGSSNEFS